MKKITLIALTILINQGIFGQIVGNKVFEQNGDYNNRRAIIPSANRVYLSDTALIIQANILLNVIADSYVVTFGVAESSEKLKDANVKIDDRIQKFISALKKMGVKETDIYVDMTTQTQIYDYKIVGDYAEQFLSGFEQKKNIIVKFTDIKDLDKMVIIASDYGIYDLVKVDYIVTNIDKIYTQLFSTAIELLNNKKDLYVKATNMKLKKSAKINAESFYSIYPSELYKQYTPKNISSEYSDYTHSRRRKDLQKGTTYYYDKINYSNFDKVINTIVTEPTVEFILILQLKFDIDKCEE